MIPTQDMINLYIKDHLTMQKIADIAGVSRQAIHKRLKKAGIKASDGEWITLVCKNCNREFKITRSRGKRFSGHYCSKDCYYDFVTLPGGFTYRWGGYKARVTLNKVFELKSGMVVHHKDGNQENNDLSNLMVFKDQADHLKFHRNDKADPLWPAQV